YLVDDASDDGSVEALRTLAAGDPRVTLVERSERAGPQAARQTGLDAARGPLVAILDSDDLWEPSKREREVAVFTEAASAGRPLPDVETGLQAQLAARWLEAGERAKGLSSLARAVTGAGPRSGLRVLRRYGPFTARALLTRR